MWGNEDYGIIQGYLIPIVWNRWALFMRVYHLIEVHRWQDAL
jgi:hypothetical protein